ncbi:MAG: MFS transporter [Proteobacteria bacterium]|nr:MFS transporter [Pseudomonadota bacterium]
MNPARLFPILTVLMAGYGSVYTLLAEIRDQFGFDETAVGAIGAAGFAAGFAAQVSLSRFADRGHTRAMLRAGAASALLGVVGMGLADALWEFIASRILLGLGTGCFAPAVRRLVVASEPGRAGERLGWLASFEIGGFLCGPVLAAALSQLWGMRSVFALLALALLLLSPALIRLEAIPATGGVARQPLRALLRRRGVRATLLAGLAFYTTVGVFEALWAILLTDRGAGPLFIGATLSLFSVPMLFLPPIAGRLAQRRGPMRVAAVGIGCAIPCMLAYGFVTPLWALAVLVALHSVADSYTMPANQLAIARASGPELLAAGQGLLGALGQATAAATALAGAWVYQVAGPGQLFGGSAILMLLLLGGAVRLGSELLHPEREGA